MPRTRSAASQRTDQTQTDGYVTTIAQPVSGSVVLGFRQGNGNPVGGSTATPGDSFNITGYYFQVDPAAKTYSIFKVDGDGQSSPVTSGNLSSGLATHFAVSVLYKGSQITVVYQRHPSGNYHGYDLYQRLDVALHVGRDDLHQRDYVSARQLARVA